MHFKTINFKKFAISNPKHSHIKLQSTLANQTKSATYVVITLLNNESENMNSQNPDSPKSVQTTNISPRKGLFLIYDEAKLYKTSLSREREREKEKI